ncbi:hypothetical protein F4859DRAFT_381683 [Xylaria cf. heliscus]|nr:hypothetical protein F4859DRAFT_381683 [Xylaria cf. heliscus]
MASKTTYIPRFLLPQSGPMWRAAAVRSAAFSRPLNVEVGQVMVRYASQTASRRPAAAKSAVTKATAQRTASTKASAASKAAKHSAPTKPPPKTPVKTSASSTSAPKAATSQKAAAPVPKPTTAAATPASAPAASKAAASKPAAAAAAAATPPAADPSKPIVLEKPERFNPPSHGSRLPRSTPRHYGGSPTAEEIHAQSQRSYPGLPPPPNTWSHWFINNRGIHVFITLGTLTSLALYTFCANFQATSPFADMIPPISEFPRHPIQYLGVCVDVLRLHEEHESALTAEKRRRRVDDVTKRNEYRKAHGLEPATSGLFGTGSRKDAEESPEPETAHDDASPQAAAAIVQSSSESVLVPEPEPEAEPTSAVAVELTPEEGKRKKFLGIF